MNVRLYTKQIHFLYVKIMVLSRFYHKDDTSWLLLNDGTYISNCRDAHLKSP
jgi:hypothetical protein